MSDVPTAELMERLRRADTGLRDVSAAHDRSVNSYELILSVVPGGGTHS